MKVRTRFVLAFAYVSLVVIVALTVPLGLVLRDRARSELESLVLSNAQTIAAVLDADRLERAIGQLQADVERFADEVAGRVVVLDAAGTVLADSDLEDVGQDFATSGRPEVAAALASRAAAQTRSSEEAGGDIAVAAAPVIDSETVVGVVRVSRGVAEVQGNVTRATIGIVAVAIAGLVAGLGLAYGLATSLARPLTRLASVARRLGAGDLQTRAGRLGGGTEVAQLAGSFDEMASRLERTVQAQREFVANASHQLRTPLTGLKLRLESAIQRAADAASVDELRAAEREVDRLAQIVERLLVLAREIEEGRPTHVDLADAAARAADRWRERAERAGSAVRADGEAVVALADPADVDQVLDVVLDNALQHGAGPIEIHIGADGGRASLRVLDHGPGIAEDERARVTDRFYRGRGAAEGGSGLGLAIARELTERWGGTLAVGGDDEGTAVQIRLRLVDRDEAT